MAIRIQTEKPVIPIELGSLNFEFEITDENIQRLYQSLDRYEEEAKAIKEEDLEGAKNAIRKGMDFLLGEGTFDKIYEEFPSTIAVSNYFIQIAEGLEREIAKKSGQSNQQKADRYLQNKNHKNRKNRNKNRR